MVIFNSYVSHYQRVISVCVQSTSHADPWGDLSQVGKHAVLANPSSKGPREFIVLSEMQAGAEDADFSTADGEKITRQYAPDIILGRFFV